MCAISYANHFPLELGQCLCPYDGLSERIFRYSESTMMVNEIGIVFDELCHNSDRGGFTFKRFCSFMDLQYKIYSSDIAFTSDKTFSRWYYGWASSQPQDFPSEGQCKYVVFPLKYRQIFASIRFCKRERECKNGPRILVCDGKVQPLYKDKLHSETLQRHTVLYMLTTFFLYIYNLMLLLLAVGGYETISFCRSFYNLE